MRKAAPFLLPCYFLRRRVLLFLQRDADVGDQFFGRGFAREIAVDLESRGGRGFAAASGEPFSVKPPVAGQESVVRPCVPEDGVFSPFDGLLFEAGFRLETFRDGHAGIVADLSRLGDVGIVIAYSYGTSEKASVFGTLIL